MWALLTPLHFFFLRRHAYCNCSSHPHHKHVSGTLHQTTPTFPLYNLCTQPFLQLATTHRFKRNDSRGSYGWFALSLLATTNSVRVSGQIFAFPVASGAQCNGWIGMCSQYWALWSTRTGQALCPTLFLLLFYFYIQDVNFEATRQLGCRYKIFWQWLLCYTKLVAPWWPTNLNTIVEPRYRTLI